MSFFGTFRNFKRKVPLLVACLALPAMICVATNNPVLGQSRDDFAALTSELQTLKSEIQALKSEIRRLNLNQSRIRKELAITKRRLEQRPQTRARARKPAFKPRDLDIAGAPVIGRADAPVTLVEFTDFQCPYCRRHNAKAKMQLVKNYVEAGKLRYASREFPIADIHPRAPKASEAALCAQDQNRYWEMRDKMFANQRKLGLEDLAKYAEGLGLDMVAFRDCLDGNKYTQRVRDDLLAGVRAGVSGTPSFFLGLTDRTTPNKFKASRRLVGAQTFHVFKQAIDALLAQAGKQNQAARAPSNR